MITGLTGIMHGLAAATGAVPHRYWRVYVDSNSGAGDFTAIAEIEFRATAGGADQTGSGTAISGGPGTDGTGNEASKAFDNDGTTQWARSSTGAVWVGYDFGSGNAVSVAEVALQCKSNATTDTDLNRLPASAKVEYSDDASTWTQAFAFTCVGWLPALWQTYPAVSPAAGYHRFWRVFCANNNGGTSFITLAEVEFRATVGGADQCPDMGTYIASGGHVIYSSDAPGNEAWKALTDDGNTSSWAGNGTTNQWLGFVFPSAVTVAQVALTCTTQTTRAPNDVHIDYSDDGVIWTTGSTTSLGTWTSVQTKTVTP